MQLNDFAINVFFVGTPGILCYFLLSKLVGRCGRNNVESFLLIFLFSLGSYGTYSLGAQAVSAITKCCDDSSAVLLMRGIPENLQLRPVDVLGASVVATFLAYVLAYGYTYNWINRFGQKIHATNRAGDEDVWHFFHNQPFASEWVVVRDHKMDLQYFGAVSHWSESGESRELLLQKVSVYTNAEVKFLYDCDLMYLCRNTDDLTIEVYELNATPE